MAFLDGNDLCAGCGACCTNTTGLKLTATELERLPRFAPLITARDDIFAKASWTGPCPYLLPDRRCGVFDQRPGDCAAYPMDISQIGVRQPDGSIEVRFRFEAGDCPERLEFIRLAAAADPAPAVAWLREATGSDQVRLMQDPAQTRKTRVLLVLHRLGVAVPLLRRLGRVASRPPVADGDGDGESSRAARRDP